MSGFAAAFGAEWLKFRRSRLPPLVALGFSLAPLMGALFMFILEDPERARALGIITTKAQLAGDAADWPTYFGVLAQATAIGGGVLFALIAAWVFGREFADRTVKELLAVPTRRDAIVAAKFAVVAIAAAALTALVLAIALPLGAAVGMPGWSAALLRRGTLDLAVAAGLTLALMAPVALLASAGRGYLAPIGFALLTVFLAQIAAATGWGSWFPWSVPALYSGLAGPRAAQLGLHSYIAVALASAAGLAATFAWWRSADQTR